MVRIIGGLVCGVCVVLFAAHGSTGQEKKGDDVKDIDGLWALEAREENGKEHPPGDDALYFERKTVLWTNKAGTQRSGQTGMVKLDPSKSPKTIDYLITRGSSNGQKQLGIYKLEGDKLVIAVNGVGNEERPQKFTTALTAGAARALEVFTYSRVKPKD